VTARTLKPCGTRAAYVRHCAAGELIDDACRQANTLQQAAWRERAARKRRVAELHQQVLIRDLIHVLACALGAGRTHP